MYVAVLNVSALYVPSLSFTRALKNEAFRWERLVDRAENVQLEPTMLGSKASSKACNMFNCFDVYRLIC